MSQETATERAERMVKVADKMKAKQTVAPAQPAPERPLSTDELSMRKMVEDAGWTFAGTNDRGESLWEDPAGNGDRRGTMVEAKELPTREGEPIMIKQLVVPPSGWSCRLSDAYNTQRARNRASEANKQAAGAA